MVQGAAAFFFFLSFARMSERLKKTKIEFSSRRDAVDSSRVTQKSPDEGASALKLYCICEEGPMALATLRDCRAFVDQGAPSFPRLEDSRFSRETHQPTSTPPPLRSLFRSRPRYKNRTNRKHREGNDRRRDWSCPEGQLVLFFGPEKAGARR